jgi:uncharacterized protein (DUF58 family)
VSRAAGIVAAGGALILAAYAFANAELLVPGVAFALLGGVTGPGMWVAARAASVTRSIETERVVEDQPLEARIEVRGGLLGLPGAEILDPLAGATIRLRGSTYPLGRSTEVRVLGRFHRRGRHHLEPPILVLTDPLALVRIVRRSLAETQTFLVLPRIERLRLLGASGAEQLDRPAGPMGAEMLAALEVDGLRPYRAGTPASRISWSALARGAGLLERRLRAERDTGPLVVLDLRSAGPSEDVDAAVRAAASLTFELAGRTGCELLLPGDRRPVQIGRDLGAWPAAHARLALIEGGPDTPAPWPSSGVRSGAIFYVAAQPQRLPSRLLRGAESGLVLVLPTSVSPGQRAVPRFEVSGCRGYRIGERAALASSEERAA